MRLAEWVGWSFPESCKIVSGKQLALLHSVIGGDRTRIVVSELEDLLTGD